MAGALVTTVVGSFPQPEWLMDREPRKPAATQGPRPRALADSGALPRAGAGRCDAPRDPIMEDAGIDVITDGEMRRESYSNRFATALSGVDVDNPGVALDRTGHAEPGAEGRRPGPAHRIRSRCSDVQFRLPTTLPIKITVPGPFTMTQQAQNDHYADERALALDYAAAVNEEIKDLFAAGADVVQIDEPYLQARPENARKYAVDTINRALEGVGGTTALHTCFGYAHIVHTRLPGYNFLAELNDCTVDQISRSRPPSRTSTSRSSTRSPTRRSSSASSTWGSGETPRRRRSSPGGSAAR